MKEEHAPHVLKKVGGSKFKKLSNNPIKTYRKNHKQKVQKTIEEKQNRTNSAKPSIFFSFDEHLFLCFIHKKKGVQHIHSHDMFKFFNRESTSPAQLLFLRLHKILDSLM